MNIHAPLRPIVPIPAITPEQRARVAAAIASGEAIAYVGAGLLPLDAFVPTTPESLASHLARKSPVPGRLRGNVWASAQYIESHKHHRTLTRLMTEAFAPPLAPSALQGSLARLPVPLIVDVWYDGAQRAALAATGRTDWGEIQGIKRGAEFRDIWYKAYDAAGEEVAIAAAEGWTTLLYKPHGAVTPAGNFLVSDSDYVEVLTEIDLQTPIPAIVQRRRRGRAFVFIGTRFHDQMLRTYARQIIKRAGEGHVALVPPDASMTRNELKFFAECGVTPLAMPGADMVALLA